MALTPEDLDSRIAGQADDYLFVLDALRWCMPRNNIVGWDAYLSGDVSRSKVPATVENIGAMV
ncbi:MAG TPA: hypothetical protein VLE74_01245, partial [Candidatus Saccharimonadales bacterium]|nr:hypothetical protein [Candidatus Saccharimonadales bacterium]